MVPIMRASYLILTRLVVITYMSIEKWILFWSHSLFQTITCILHGPSMFAVRAKIYGVLYNQASSVAFDETSSYWSALKRS